MSNCRNICIFSLYILYKKKQNSFFSTHFFREQSGGVMRSLAENPKLQKRQINSLLRLGSAETRFLCWRVAGKASQRCPVSSTINAAFQRGGCKAREHNAPVAQAAFHNPSSGRSLKSNQLSPIWIFSKT